MSKLNQKGVVQAVVLLILVVGLGAALYLSQKTTIFKPKAYEQTINGGPPINVSPPPGYNACESSLTAFEVSDPCDEVENGFQNVKFGCEAQIQADLNAQGGQERTCRTVAEWASIAQRACRQLCPLQTPPPAPVPCQENSDCQEGYTCVITNSCAPPTCPPGISAQECEELQRIAVTQCVPGTCVLKPTLTPSPNPCPTPPVCQGQLIRVKSSGSNQCDTSYLCI